MARIHSQLRRLFWIDAALQRGGFPSAADLARELGVSRTTIHRDFQVLRSKFRAPLIFDPTQGGHAYGHRFCPDLPDLPIEETIQLGGTLLRRGEIGGTALGEGLLRLLHQLSRLLPDAGHEAPAKGPPAEALPPAETIPPSEAISSLALTAAGTTPRPPRSGPGRRPHGKARTGAVGAAPPDKTEPVTIVLRFDRAVKQEMLHARLVKRSEVQLLTNGGFEATVTAEDPDTFLLDLLRWAPHFEIARPPWIRRRLPQLLRHLLKQLEPRKKRQRRRRR